MKRAVKHPAVTPIRHPMLLKTTSAAAPHPLRCRLLAAVLSSVPLLLHAQDVGPPTVPGRDPQAPALVQPTRPAPQLQAPAAAPPGVSSGLTGAGSRIRLQQVRVTGSTVFSQQELAEVAAPYVGRDVSAEDLAALRQALTLKYIQAGYINSGALLPDQQVADGVVEFRIVEGGLSGITVSGNKRLRDAYVADRLALAGSAPLNVNRLQDRLQTLLQGPFIEIINAELTPGDRPGEARLSARIQEGKGSQVSATLDNDFSPSLGPARAGLRGQVYSPGGRGDIFGWELAAASGYRKISASYAVPLTATDLMLEVFADTSRAEVVETPLNALDIQSRSSTLGLRISYPVLHTAREQFTLSAGLDVRQSTSELLGTGFAFSPGVQADGKSKVSVLRFVQDYVGRDSGQVTAVRSTFSLGTGAFGATDLGNNVPNGKFLAWLGQFQHARRLGTSDNQLVFRFDAQLTNKPLLPMEQFAVGGARTVRGFRANQLVRDQGFAASAELRMPVMRNADGGTTLQLAPFVDIGGAWYKRRPSEDPQRLSSAGVALRFDPHPGLHAELAWAKTFSGRNVVNPSSSLQDRGWHLSLRADF